MVRARAGAAKPSSAPRAGATRRVGWGAGESMTFEVRLAGIEAARAMLVVGRPGRKNGRRAIRVRGKSETIPAISAILRLREELVTLIDLEGLLPLHSRLVTEKGSRRKITVTEHGTTSSGVTRQRVTLGKRRYARTRKLPRVHYDPLSALLALRSAQLIKGRRHSLLISSGTKLYRIDLVVRGRDHVEVAGHSRPAVKLEGHVHRLSPSKRGALRRARVTLWLSADAAHVPLVGVAQSRYGPFEMRLTGYRPARKRLRLSTVRRSD